jgi:hypothetical protein
VNLEGLTDFDVVGQTQALDGDLAGHGTAIRHGEEFDAQFLGAIRFRQDVAVGLDTIGKEDGVSEIAGWEKPVRELKRRLQVGSGAEMRSFVDVVSREHGWLFRRLVHLQKARTAREGHDAYPIVGPARVKKLLQRRLRGSK